MSRTRGCFSRMHVLETRVPRLLKTASKCIVEFIFIIRIALRI